MTLANRWPQRGDAAVEFRAAGRTWEADSIGTPTTIKTITTTLVITSDGARYNRDGLFPVSEGRQSARRLVPPADERVLCVQGRARLRELARQVANLADLERKDPMDIVAAFAQIIAATGQARSEFISLTAAASKAEQESDR
jgi:hypothetical protein